MSEEGKRLPDVIATIDAANARDPNRIEVGGQPEPAELVYGRRMSEALARMAPNATEHLRIAARGQHIERWTSPRASYPAGRAGYLKWRKDLQAFHARRIGELMAVQGYGADDIARVGALIRKERLKSDAEAQMIEDVACIVFLEHYVADFLAKTAPDKLADILAKTWNKMSPRGREEAGKLALPAPVKPLLEDGLARLHRGG
jgi:Domain of unknown function (DUF4202)